MLRKLTIVTILALFTLALTLSCGGEKGQVIFTISMVEPANDPFGDIMDRNFSIPSDTVNILFENDVKNPDAFGSLTYADIIVESLTVSFTRTDGGSDKPDTYRDSVSYRVPARGTYMVNGYPILPATMKLEFPLSDLYYYQYERSTNFISIKMDILIEAEGHTIEGDRVYASGRISIEVTDWAD